MALKPRTRPDVVAEIRRRHAEGQAVKVICIDLEIDAHTVAKYTREDHPRSPERVERNRAAWNGAPRPKKLEPAEDAAPVTQRYPQRKNENA